jgi:hypothetical protein
MPVPWACRNSGYPIDPQERLLDYGAMASICRSGLVRLVRANQTWSGLI